MRKIIALTVLLISSSNYAQKRVQFGPMISFNTANVFTVGYVGDQTGTTFNFGGFIRANLKDFYGQAELGYGANKFSIADSDFTNTDYKLAGTDFSLMIGLKLIPFGKIGDARILGGYNGKYYSSIQPGTGSNGFEVHKYNNSVVVGGGVDLWKLTLDFRYLIGITDIDDSTNMAKTQAFNASLGYKFQ